MGGERVTRRLRRTSGDVPADLRRARCLPGLAGGLHWLPLVSVVLTLGRVVVVDRLWRAGAGSTAARVYLTSIAVLLLAFAPFLYHLRLLGFHY